MTETIERNATVPAAKRDMPALSPQAPKLMDQVRERLRVLHYDREHHAQTAYATRKANARTADLFDQAAK